MGMRFTRAIAAFCKVQCSTEDSRPTVHYWTGETYSRGQGFRQVSREILFYQDPATGKIIDEWQNPWSGETARVLRIANDPVNFRAPIFPLKADGKPFETDLQVMGDHWWGTTTVPLFKKHVEAARRQ